MKETSIVAQNMVGTFDLPREMLFGDWEVISGVMSQMMVVRCECLAYEDALRYIAFSPLFQPIRKDQSPPKYILTITHNEHGVDVGATRDGTC